MSAPRTVVIDGIIYVPATEAVKGIDDIMQAIYETYMGVGDRWDSGSVRLWVGVNEYGDGETLEELAARVAVIPPAATVKP